MYSTKLTVSHSICSELTPPKILQLSLPFCPFFCYIQKALLLIKQSKVHSAHPPVPTMYKPNVFIHFPLQQTLKTQTRFQYKKKKNRAKGNQNDKRNGDLERLRLFLSECLSGNNLKKKKKKFQNPTLHSVQPVYKRCHVGKILYLVNFKACQDGEPRRHYTIILGHKGLLHSLARGWNHSVTSCKQRENKNTFWLIY